jgi:hypothetical protein
MSVSSIVAALLSVFALDGLGMRARHAENLRHHLESRGVDRARKSISGWENVDDPVPSAEPWDTTVWLLLSLPAV